MTEDAQLDLFAQREPAPPQQGSRRERLISLAASLPENLRFGTSSWTFPGWSGLVYERRYQNQKTFTRESLAEYAAHPLMRTVGIDRGYYAPLADEDLAHYATQLPSDFRCVMKVWNEVTTRVFPRHARWGDRAGQHNPHFLDATLFKSSVLGPVQRAFEPHAGPFVVEIPAAPESISEAEFCDRLESFLSALPDTFPYAVELRERRLMTQGYLKVLERCGATHCFNYWARVPDLGAQRAWSGALRGDFVVLRLLMPPGRRYDELKKAYTPFDRLVDPQPKMRADTCAIVREALDRDMEVFVVVNNKAEGSSPLTVEALAGMLSLPGDAG